MIDLELFDSASKYGIVKATVHKTGKLGFSSGASKYMDLENVRNFHIGRNRTDGDDDCIYLVPLTKEADKSFSVVKAGDYFYIYIRNILREMKIDYKNEAVVYDIDEVVEEENRYYKLTRREKK